MSQKRFYIFEDKRSKLFDLNPVLTVNGNSPDSSGAVTIDTGGTVKKVNGVSPDSSGNVTINTHDSIYITSQGTTGNFYYRIWSNNFMELWWSATVSSNTVVTFPYTFANTSYKVLANVETTGDHTITISVWNRTTTGVSVVPYDSDGNSSRTLYCHLYIAGYK